MASFSPLCEAALFPPQDHGGSDLILVDGDEIWGEHTNIKHLILDGVVIVRYHDRNSTDTGTLKIYGEQIVIAGVLDATGAGFTGGGGSLGFGTFLGVRGKNRYNEVTTSPEGTAISGPTGSDGGYNEPAINSDETEDESIEMGTGGIGGSGGLLSDPDYFNCGGGGGGGGGGAGGGAVSLIAEEFMYVPGQILTRGTAGQSGTNGTDGRGCLGSTCFAGDGGDGGNSWPPGEDLGGEGGGPGPNPFALQGINGRSGGSGAGGGIMLKSLTPNSLIVTGTLDAHGGRD